jgi:hypothetical protein
MELTKLKIFFMKLIYSFEIRYFFLEHAGELRIIILMKR